MTVYLANQLIFYLALAGAILSLMELLSEEDG